MTDFPKVFPAPTASNGPTDWWGPSPINWYNAPPVGKDTNTLNALTGQNVSPLDLLFTPPNPSGFPMTGNAPNSGGSPLWAALKQAGVKVSDLLSPGATSLQGGMGSLWDGAKKLIPSGFLDKADPVTGAVKEQGWGMPAIYGLGTLGGLWQANKTYDLNKQQLAFQKDAFYANMENQRKLTNAELEHRQRARLGSGASKESVDSYMKRFGV